MKERLRMTFGELVHMSDDELYQYAHKCSSDPDAVVIMKTRWNWCAGAPGNLRRQNEQLRRQLEAANARQREAHDKLVAIERKLESAIPVSDALTEALREEVLCEWQRLLLTGRPSYRRHSICQGIGVRFYVEDRCLLKNNGETNYANAKNKKR